MTDQYTVGPLEDQPRSDIRAHFEPGRATLEIEVASIAEALFGESLRDQAAEVCRVLGIESGRLVLEDFGALPWVVSARIEAVVKKALPDLSREALPNIKPFCLYGSTRDRLRRSRLYLPGNQPKLMINAGIHSPDGVILDLEDSVAPSQKHEARYLVRNALRSLDFFGAERMVRINQGERGLEDLQFVIPHNAHLILIPKVESPEHVRQVDERINTICDRCQREEPVFLMPIIESARGVLKALEIAESSRNIVALAIGLEDYTADIGAVRTDEGKESFFARSFLVNAARAAGIQAIDTVYSDVANEEGLRASVIEARALGFDGKGCIHPRQIRPIHEAFAPSESEIEKARQIVEAFEAAQSKGLGVVAIGNKMIDPPVVKRAQQTLRMAEASGLVEFGALQPGWADPDQRS